MESADLDLLIGIARVGSLSGAAKRAGLAVSTVGRRLDVLERSLKLRLVDRRMDGARLTPEGGRIAVLGEALVADADRIARAAAAMNEEDDREAVHISATEFIVADVLAPALPLLWSSYPTLRVVLRSEAQVVSLAARQADIAVRMARPQGASLFARRLAPLRLGLFASVSYLGNRDPEALELAAERLLVYDDSYGPLPELDWLDATGLQGAVALRTGSTRALLTAAQAGAGVALLPAAFATRAGLVEVRSPKTLGGRTPWLVVHRDLRKLPSVKSANAWIVAALAAAVGRDRS